MHVAASFSRVIRFVFASFYLQVLYFIGAHVVHTALIIFWSGSMALFELSHQVPEKPLYDEGCVVLPHLASLALSIGPGGEITDIYSYFVCSALHLICCGKIDFV